MLFILAWCGNYLRENNAVVMRLMEKGSHISEEDKAEMLEALCQFVKGDPAAA